MANTREPFVKPVPILSLRPTQMTVGMREVKDKRKRWREHKSAKKRAELLGKHMIPVVFGPDQNYYVVDHHHLARALHDEGVNDILVTVIGDLTMVQRDAFWGVMDNKRWVYEIGSRAQGRPVPQPRRRIAPRRRLCQGHHAVQRIPVGGFSAPENVAQERGSKFLQVDGEGAGFRQKQGRGLSARLVWARVGRLASGAPVSISAAAPSCRTRRSGASR